MTSLGKFNTQYSVNINVTLWLQKNQAIPNIGKMSNDNVNNINIEQLYTKYHAMWV